MKVQARVIYILIYSILSSSHSQDYVHGVNIKLEKAGGIRGAISAIQTASQLNLLVWIGTVTPP